MKVPELESYSIIDHSNRHIDLKLIFKNPLHVSSLLERDFVNVKILNAFLFKASSDGHLIDQGFEISEVTVPPQTPSEEAF